MNIAELASRPVDELRTLAAQYGIPTHHRAKAETIAKLIVEYVAQPPKPPEPQVKKMPVENKTCTEEEVREVIKEYLAKPAFRATFHGDDTVTFSCAGREESIHMSAHISVIKMKAETVSKGARKPRVMNFDGDAILTV